jgi:hypothetical protein
VFIGVVIMDFQKEAALIAAKGPVIHLGRAAGIGHRAESLASDRQRTGELKDLFPVLVHERLGREGPGRKPKEPSPGASPVVRVQVAGQDLMLDPRWIPRRDLPA